jgi:hypothetical protein
MASSRADQFLGIRNAKAWSLEMATIHFCEIALSTSSEPICFSSFFGASLPQHLLPRGVSQRMKICNDMGGFNGQSLANRNLLMGQDYRNIIIILENGWMDGFGPGKSNTHSRSVRLKIEQSNNVYLSTQPWLPHTA